MRQRVCPTVRRVLEALATDPDREELRKEHPELEKADIRQVLEYAAAPLEDRVTDLPAACAEQPHVSVH